MKKNATAIIWRKLCS